jgi:hypothetical protein
VSALAPATAALTGAGAVMLWRWARESWAGLLALGAAIAATAAVAVMLLARTPDLAPAPRTLIPLAAGLAILGSLGLRVPLVRRGRALLAIAAVCGAVAVAAGPAAYSVATVGRSLAANEVLAGPASARAGLGGSGGPGGPQSGFGGPGGGTQSGAGFPTGSPPAGAASGTAVPRAGGPGGGGAVSASLIRYLEAHQRSAKYLVAATGSQTTAPIIIQTGKAVVTIGGFTGSDPAPTAAQLASMVARASCGTSSCRATPAPAASAAVRGAAPPPS